MSIYVKINNKGECNVMGIRESFCPKCVLHLSDPAQVAIMLCCWRVRI